MRYSGKKARMVIEAYLRFVGDIKGFTPDTITPTYCVHHQNENYELD
jgi:hypothetical protein